MNILMIGNAFPPTYMGGESLHLHDLATGLASRRHKTSVVHPCLTKGNGPTVRLRKVNRNLDVYAICIPEDPRSDTMMNEVFVALMKDLACKGEKIDLIHCHSNRFYDGLMALRASCPVPIVTTVHAAHMAIVSDVIVKKGVRPDPADWALYMEDQKRQSDLCMISDRIIAISKAMASHMVRYFHAEASKVRLVYNGIDARRLSAMKDPHACEQIRKNLDLGHRIVVLYAGRIEPIKGIASLAEACSRICRRDDQVGFIFLGNGSADGWLRNRLREHRQVHFVDWLDFEGIVPYYHLAEIVVVPSLIEPFGLVPLEAMACGTCVLCSNADGMDETVVHEESGFKIPLIVDSYGDRRIRAEDIENALERGIRDREWRLRLSEGGLRRAAQFTVERMVRDTECLYSELLGQTVPALRPDRIAGKGSLDFAPEENSIHP